MTTRILNNKTQIFGLSSFDLFGLAVFYSVLQTLMIPFEKEFVSLAITICLLFVLIPIRLSFRIGIIRDFLFYLLVLIFYRGFYNAS